MRGLFILLLLGMFSLVTFGQNSTIDARLGYDETFKTVTLSSSDSIGVGDSLWTYTVYKKTRGPSICYYRLYLDSLSGTSDTVDIFLQKKVFGTPQSSASEGYTNVDTVTYYGTADTGFSAVVSSAQYADFWRLTIKERGDNFKVGIDSVMFKFFE